MPQFDFQHVFLPQVIWLAIFFAILYFGIVRLTLPKLGRVIAEREDAVSGDLSAAEAAKANADRMKADYDAGVATAQDMARARMATAHSDAAAKIEAKLGESKAVLDARASAANVALETARNNALGQIEGVAADAAADIVEKLTGVRPADSDTAVAARSAMGVAA